MCSLSYESRLKALGLERLELRHLRMDLISCYNVVHRRVSIPFDSFFLNLGGLRIVALAVIRLNYFILILE